jgi:hypothetical protein
MKAIILSVVVDIVAVVLSNKNKETAAIVFRIYASSAEETNTKDLN